MIIPLYFYFNLIAILFWLWVRSRFKDPFLDLVGILISVGFIIEILALAYSYGFKTSNHWIYNVFTAGQIAYIAFIYSKLISNKKISNQIRLLLLIFMILVVLNFIFLQSFFKFHTFSYILGCFLIFFISIQYLKQLLNEKNWQPLKKLPFFWITTGNIIFYICSMFYMGSINYINDKNFDEYGSLISIFVYLFTSVQFILYTIAFLCNLNPEKR
ncbi:MAG: hypothetical protein ACRC2O_05845 [Chitinophagaceae bacterium]